MKTYFLFFLNLLLTDGQTLNFGSDFLKAYEVVTPKPLESLAALPRCGEGDLFDKFLCVPYYNCDPKTRTVREVPNLQDYVNLIDIRQRDDQAKCSDYLDVCCGKPNNTGTVTVTSTESTIRAPKPTGNFCGIRNSNGVYFKITGNGNNEAEFGEFPWMVAIMKQSEAICGGSLITPIVVLTGAHCLEGLSANDIKIRAGEWDTKTEKEPIAHQERNVRKVIMHEKYTSKVLYNDVALLILDRSLVKADNIGTICLPNQGIQVTAKNCFATGWGKNFFGKEGQYAAILKKIKLPIVQHSICQSALRKTRLGKWFELHQSFICAGGEPNQDTCTGDGGSPLVCEDNNRFFLTGMVAWGIGCGGRNIPGVYVNVALFRDWIDNKLQEENLNRNPYIF